MSFVKESISFERGMDPKKMLGIGDFYIIKHCIENIYKEDFKNDYIEGSSSEKGNIIYIAIKEENGKLTFVIQFYSNLFTDSITKKTLSKEKYAKKLISNAEISDYLYDCAYYGSGNGGKIYQYICFIKPEYARFFEEIKGIHYHTKYDYLIESISFERGIDPKAMLGIGNDFNTLSKGAILKPKRSGIALTQNRSGQFTNWLNGWKLYPNSYLLVLSISNYSTGGKYKRISFSRAYGEYTEIGLSVQKTKSAWESVKELKNILISSGDFRSWSTNNMIVSEKMFNSRFEIIEKGI